MIINAVKYAFTHKSSKNEIFISLKKEAENALMIVADNGVGMPKLEGKLLSSLGLMVITGSIQQLNGSYEMKNENGTRWIITIPLKTLLI